MEEIADDTVKLLIEAQPNRGWVVLVVSTPLGGRWRHTLDEDEVCHEGQWYRVLWRGGGRNLYKTIGKAERWMKKRADHKRRLAIVNEATSAKRTLIDGVLQNG